MISLRSSFQFLPLSLLLIFSSYISRTRAEQPCYALDGSRLDANYGPCDPSQAHSGCCAIHRPPGSVDICLSNGLCMATNQQYMGTIWQNGCTDPTLRDEACTRLCPDLTNDFAGLNAVTAWNIQQCDYGTYCCRAVNDRRNCCANATAPRVVTDYLGEFKFATSTAGLPPSFSSSSTLPTSSTTATTISPASTATPSTPPADLCKREKEKTAIVGGAVGGFLGTISLILLGLVGWMVHMERRERRRREVEKEVKEVQQWVLWPEPGQGRLEYGGLVPPVEARGERDVAEKDDERPVRELDGGWSARR